MRVKSAEVRVAQLIGSLPVRVKRIAGPVWFAETGASVSVGPSPSKLMLPLATSGLRLSGLVEPNASIKTEIERAVLSAELELNVTARSAFCH